MKFELNDEQIKKFKEWRGKQPPDLEDSFLTRFTFEFTPSGIGTSVRVIDVTGEILDLSDDGDWG